MLSTSGLWPQCAVVADGHSFNRIDSIGWHVSRRINQFVAFGFADDQKSLLLNE